MIHGVINIVFTATTQKCNGALYGDMYFCQTDDKVVCSSLYIVLYYAII